jgi:predicted Zn finger-like uncharacterized protein
MRLTCPNCGARYEVDDALIPPEGRDVQCSDCVTTWFQAGRRTAAPEAPAARPPFAAQVDTADDAEGEAAEDTEDDIEAATEVQRAKAEADAPPDVEPEAETETAQADGDPAEPPEDDAGTEAEEAPGRQETGADAPTEVQTPPEHIEEPDDEVLSAIPESAESATQVVGENDARDPEIDEAEIDAPANGADDPDPQTEATSDMGGRREIDPDVRDILRAEADREARLRRAEADPVETQSEMPLAEAPEDEHRARRRAELEDAEDAFAVGAASAGHANGSRRDLLPDIEEINSTLRATEDRGGSAQDDAAAQERAVVAQRRRGVRLGFFVTLALTAGLIWVYVNAEMLSDRVPAVAGAVEGFTAQVDVARLWLDDLARNLAESGEES